MAREFGNTAAATNLDPYPVGVPRKLAYPDLPAWGLLERAAILMPGRAACVYNDVEWTWEELNLDAIRTAAALRRLGVRPGDRVGILLPNIPEYLIALNGIWRAGGIAVALSPMAVPEEVDRMLQMTECRIVICLDMLVGLISGTHRPDKTLLVSLRPQLPLFEQLGYLYLRKRRTGLWWMSATEHVAWFWDEVHDGTDFVSPLNAQDQTSRNPNRNPLLKPTALDSPSGDGEFWASLRRGDNALPEARLTAASAGVEAVLETHAEASNTDWSTVPAYILPTGGTTGEPKAVTLSHRNMVANAWQQYYWAGAAVGQETLLAVLPFFHSYGLSTNVMGGAAMVATLIMDHRFNVRKAIRLIETQRPTVFHAVPAMLVAMNEHLRKHPADLTSLKWVISGGATLPEAVGQEFAKHTQALVVEGYGLSEASPVTHVGPLDGSARFGTIGLPLPDTECRIVNSDDGKTDIDNSEVGELLVRGPQVMLGYWGNPLKPTTSKDGWLATGDLARLTPEGLYQIVERKKDLIITSGFNVYPQDVEHVLRQHSSVRDAAVVGIPDEQRGEIVKAFVVLQESAKWDLTDLMKHCREHLSAHKRPRQIERCKGDLPRSFLGKVIRRKLRE